MGFYGALANSSFKRTADGRMAFYPWGRLGKGYLVPTAVQYNRLRLLVTLICLGSLPFALLAAIAGHWLLFVPLLPVILLVYWIFVRLLTRRMPRTDEKLTLRDIYENHARHQSLFRLWFLLLAALGLFVLGIHTVVTGGDPVKGTLLIFGGGSCAALFGGMLRSRRRLRAEPQPYTMDAYVQPFLRTMASSDQGPGPAKTR